MKVKRKTPKKIKIGYSEFKLIPRSNQWGKRNKALGDCLPEAARIQFDSSQRRNELVNTILHETLHGIVYMFDINFKNMKEEEKVVRKMANGLHTVFKDNPNFLEWILQQNLDNSDE
jgi:hypothetical protein